MCEFCYCFGIVLYGVVLGCGVTWGGILDGKSGMRNCVEDRTEHCECLLSIDISGGYCHFEVFYRGLDGVCTNMFDGEREESILLCLGTGSALRTRLEAAAGREVTVATKRLGAGSTLELYKQTLLITE